VHRDLKPDNVLIAKDGRVALSDFGIARAVQSGAQVMTSGMPMGTPAYMAPEQVEGGQVDARTDVYALGAMLYEMMTRERPWQGETVYAVAAARLTKPPPNPRALRPGLPSAVAEVVVRSMARKPEDRYARADDVARALDAALAGYEASRPLTPARIDRIEPEAKTVAVLPFRNLGKPDDDYLADGLTDDLIDALSMTRGLRVRARGAVMKYKGVDRDPRDTGRELDVQVVADGSVRKVGSQLRVSARLVSVADGFQLWAKRFDAPEQDFLAVGDEAANAIAQALTLERAAPARDAPTDPVAIDLYLRARHAFHQAWVGDIRVAIDLFEQALARAPDDPTILAGYALAQLRKFANDLAGTDESGEIGRNAAERALALAPHLGEPRVALANLALNLGDAVGAAIKTREALKVAPGTPDVHDLRGRMLVEAGAVDEGIISLRTAIAIEPHGGRAFTDLVRTFALLGHWEQVNATFETWKTSNENPNFYWFLGARLALWRRDEAWAARVLETVQAREFPLKSAVTEFCTLVRTRVISPSLESMAVDWGAMRSRAVRRPMFFQQLSAEVMSFVGRTDEALAGIEAADRLGLIDITWMDRCPLLEPLRTEARFVAVRPRVAERGRAVVEAMRG
jgi:serine/threonine-protein kinase